MKIEIDISDFYLDDDHNLEDALKKYIVSQVVLEINSRIKDQIQRTITMEVQKMVLERMVDTTNKYIEEWLESGRISTDFSNSSMVTVREYMIQKFQNKNGWGNPSELIEKKAKSLGAELKERYDREFATQVVLQLEKNGMLKENVAKLLLETKP